MYWLYAVYTVTILPALSCPHSSFFLSSLMFIIGGISYLVSLFSIVTVLCTYVISLHNVCLMTLMLRPIHAYDVRSASSTEDHAARIMPQLHFRIGRIGNWSVFCDMLVGI